MATDNTRNSNTTGAQAMTGAYGTYQGRSITREEYDRLSETDRTQVQLMNTGAYGTYEGRNISRDEYERMAEADRMRVQLIEETLHVDKNMRQAGEVAVSKHVVSEQVQVPVTLQHEEVVVTRRAVDTPVDAATAARAFQDETIKVAVNEEVAVVTKQAHVAEEIEIQKRAVSEQQTVTDTVRHEELDVQGNPPNRVRTEGQNNPPKK